MNRILITTGIFLILIILSLGCTLQDPKDHPSYSVYPEVLIDYDFDSTETKVWVKSALSDFKYDQIVIEALDENGVQTVSENNTYCISLSTKATKFNLTIYAISEENQFGYSCNIDIDLELIEEALITITIFDHEEETEEIIEAENLPFKKVLKEQ
jgi:hypothetical protein